MVKITSNHKDNSNEPLRREYKINEHLTLCLEGKTTFIYVDGEIFQQCKSLAVALPIDLPELRKLNEIKSIDEFMDLKQKYEGYFKDVEPLSPEQEFMGHCSNLEAWYEHAYDTRLIDSVLGFPLLKRLTEAGDKKAAAVFKHEILKRFKESHPSTLLTLYDLGLLKFITRDEYWSFFPENFAPLKRVEKLLGAMFCYQGGRPIIYDKKQSFKNAFFYNKGIYLAFTTEGEGKNKNLGFLLIRYLPEVKEETWEAVFRELGKMENLKHLRISNCSIPKLPETFGLLKNLEWLDLHKNEIRELPDSLEYLSRLKFLNLTDNKIEKFPLCLTKLTLLKKLFLIRNNLENLPEKIMNLKNLKEFGIGENNFRYVSPVVKRWLKLNELSLRHLDDIPLK